MKNYIHEFIDTLGLILLGLVGLVAYVLDGNLYQLPLKGKQDAKR